MPVLVFVAKIVLPISRKLLVLETGVVMVLSPPIGMLWLGNPAREKLSGL